MQYIINEKIEIAADDKKLIDDLSKKVINDFASEYEKLSALSRETLEPVIKILIEKHRIFFVISLFLKTFTSIYARPSYYWTLHC